MSRPPSRIEEDTGSEDPGAFRFTDLPGEQRNSIYRYLFDDITTADKPFHVWKETEGLPSYPGLEAYAALTLTCRQVKQEASTIFESDYLPHMTFYFDSLKALGRLVDTTVDHIINRAGSRFMLRAPTTEHNTLYLAPTEHLLGEKYGIRDFVGFESIPPFSRWPKSADREGESAFHVGEELVGETFQHGDVIYMTIKMQKLPSYLRGLMLFRVIQSTREITTIFTGRFCAFNWCAGEGREWKRRQDKLLAEWEVRRQGERETTPFDNLQSVPNMERFGLVGGVTKK